MSDERFILKNARHLAARYMEEILRPGDVAVDATMGNGKDTQFLCELVGETGHVYAFDVQEEALERTAARLEAAGLRARATLILAGHETMRENVPVSPRAVMFNLGWLPGAAHNVTTRTETTMRAVQARARTRSARRVCEHLRLSRPRGGHAGAARAAGVGGGAGRARLQRAAPQLHRCQGGHPAAPSDSEKRMMFKKMCDKTLTNSPAGAFARNRAAKTVKKVSF